MLMLAGQSRSGKTSIVKKFVLCLACQQYDEATGETCNGCCKACAEFPEKSGQHGLDSYRLTTDERTPVHLIMADATLFLTPQEVQKFIIQHSDYDGIRIVFIDEVHRLADKSMESMFLKAVEERSFFWIFATARPEQLDSMFLNRLIKLETELPTEEELGDFLVDRCLNWGINFEPEAILRTVEKSNLITGTALQALALAAVDPEEGLTLELVEDWMLTYEK